MPRKSTDAEWTLVADRLPPAGLVVETKIDYGHGVHNEQPLVYRDHLWWTSGYDMYVYYVPTHWRAKRESK